MFKGGFESRSSKEIQKYVNLGELWEIVNLGKLWNKSKDWGTRGDPAGGTVGGE